MYTHGGTHESFFIHLLYCNTAIAVKARYSCATPSCALREDGGKRAGYGRRYLGLGCNTYKTENTATATAVDGMVVGN